MPSPIGHALAGFTLGLLVERPADSPINSTGPQPLLTRFTLLGALFAALPDADLLFAPLHRGWTHSFGASLLILIVAAAVTGQVNRARRVRKVHEVREVREVRRGRGAWRLAVVLSLAQASHIVLDWMGTDHSTPGGLQALWPLTREFYMSGWDFFPETERNFAKPEIIVMNAWALFFEVVVLGPIALLAILFTRTRRTRVPISGRDGPPQPSA